MIKSMNYRVFLVFAFIFVQCTGEKTTSLIKININDTKKLTSYYYRDNLENISHFDSINFVWSAKKMLEDSFVLKPIEEHGQAALFSPNVQGSYKIELNVQHKWTGKILDTEYYDIIVTGAGDNDSSQPYNRQETSIRKETKIDKNDISYSVQISSWSKESGALKEKKIVEKFGYNPYIEEFDHDSQLWWRVRLGPYSSKAEAKRIQNKVNKDLNKKCWIDLSKESSSSSDKKLSKKESVEVENLIDYEDEIGKKAIEVENLIDYEDEVGKKAIEVENLIDYEDEIGKKENNKYYIQISTWTTKKDAQNEVKKLKALGYKPFILENYDKNKQLWHKVRIGPLSNQEAINLKYKVSKDLGKDVWVDKNN